MIRKLFSQMVFTQVISCMAVTLCMLIDSIIIGRFLGVDAMAAYGYTQPEDKTKSVMIGLCIEEITCNTVTHGFSKGYAREAVYLNTLGLNNLLLTL